MPFCMVTRAWIFLVMITVLGLFSVVRDALIVHSHQATLEASAFYGIFLVPEDMHHYSNSSVSLLH